MALAVAAAPVACGPGSSTTTAGDSSGSGGGEETTGDPSSSESSADACPDLVHDGDLALTPESDLAAIAGITEVRGDLDVARLYALEDLSVLACLHRIEGRMLVWNNASLRSLEGLNRLEHVGGGIGIESNGLETLSGLDSLRELSVLAVRSNPNLTSVGLASLEVVDTLEIGHCYGGGPPPDGPLQGYGNESLRELGGFESLESVGVLRIEWNDALDSLEGLRAMANSGGTVGEVAIRHNASLPTEHVGEIVDLLGAAGTVCGNLGDLEAEQCECDPVKMD